MEINDSLKKTAGLGVRTTHAPAGRSGTAEQVTIASTGSAADNVTLSSQAQAISAASGAGPVFDASKVEEIRRAIASGQFKVDPEKVAQGLLDTVRDLIATRSKE